MKKATVAQQIEHVLSAKIAERTTRGLKIVVQSPDSPELYTCYPKDDTQKQAWLARLVLQRELAKRGPHGIVRHWEALYVLPGAGEDTP